jgi:long-chain fatty acid transport protein
VSAYQRFAQQFAIMGDVTWTHWDRLQTVPIVFSNAATPASVLTINYENTLRYAVGLEWYASKKFTFRTGFAYDETPIRSEEFRTPRIPDNDRYFVSAGLRWTPLDYMDVDLGYAHLFVDQPRSEFNDGRGHLLSGSYDAQVNIISASVTLRWGGGKHVVSETSGKDVAGFRK